jgi:flagellar basal body-associated protein FliL
MQQLNFMKVQIREKLNEAVGEELVKDIYLKSGSLREEVENSAPRTFKKMEQRALSSEEKDAVAKATEEVADPELRNTLASFFSLHLSNQKNQDSPKTPSAS